MIVAAVVAAAVARFPHRADGETALGRHRNDFHDLRIGHVPALLDADDHAVAFCGHHLDWAVRVPNPHVLGRLDERVVFPFIAGVPAVAEELSGVTVAPVEVAERAQGAERRGDIDANASNEETGPNHEPE